MRGAVVILGRIYRGWLIEFVGKMGFRRVVGFNGLRFGLF